MEKLANKIEIMKILTIQGWQPTSVMTFCFDRAFTPAIKELHAEGKVERYRNGWKAVKN